MTLLVALALAGQMLSSQPASPEPPKGDYIQAFCKGCGCRGGPGWRIHRTGQCAGKKNLAEECGSPPSPSLCTKEN